LVGEAKGKPVCLYAAGRLVPSTKGPCLLPADGRQDAPASLVPLGALDSWCAPAPTFVLIDAALPKGTAPAPVAEALAREFLPHSGAFLLRLHTAGLGTVTAADIATYLAVGLTSGADIAAKGNRDGSVSINEWAAFVAEHLQANDPGPPCVLCLAAQDRQARKGPFSPEQLDALRQPLPDTASMPEDAGKAADRFVQVRGAVEKALASGALADATRDMAQLVDAWKGMDRLLKGRTAAENARKTVSETRRQADAIECMKTAPEPYVAGVALQDSGMEQFQAGQYEVASLQWASAAAQFRRASIQALSARLKETTDALPAEDAAIYGAALWPEVKRLEVQALRAWEDKDLATAVTAYEGACNLLPRLRTAVMENLLGYARRYANPDGHRAALVCLERLLSLEPTHAEAVALRQLIRANCRFSPGTLRANPAGMLFAYIPPGTFQMGSPDTEVGRDPDEGPHQVTLHRGFFLAVTEVTREQWLKVMGYDYKPPQGVHPDDEQFAQGTVDSPKRALTFDEAVEFCRRLSQIDGRTYRLPTEAEWEYACRAGTTTPFNNGTDRLTAEDAVVYTDTAPPENAAAVKTGRKPNAWGLYDMHGNAWEWCADWSGPYAADAQTDPRGAPPPARPEDGRKVVRGGSWFDEAVMARSANRWEYTPATTMHTIGFRVLLEAHDVD
ncbi:MAG: SUMF1/EgtB/PvdO family nonheme iron enzyme, partial [Lentisphaeria bacterium]|nr:SUMF1/EgtB/PvdO family nonheme iron enzyme [Lentisphaeria bacterium]